MTKTYSSTIVAAFTQRHDAEQNIVRGDDELQEAHKQYWWIVLYPVLVFFWAQLPQFRFFFFFTESRDRNGKLWCLWSQNVVAKYLWRVNKKKKIFYSEANDTGSVNLLICSVGFYCPFANWSCSMFPERLSILLEQVGQIVKLSVSHAELHFQYDRWEKLGEAHKTVLPPTNLTASDTGASLIILALLEDYQLVQTILIG